MLRIMPCSAYLTVPWVLVLHKEDESDSYYQLLQFPGWKYDGTPSSSESSDSDTSTIIIDGECILFEYPPSPTDD